MPGQTLSAGLAGDRLVELRIERASDGAQPGDALQGVVRRAGAACFLEMAGEQVLLDRAQSLREGQPVTALVTRAAIPEPGRLKPARATPARGAVAPRAGGPEPIERIDRFPERLGVDEALEAALTGLIDCGDFALGLERTRIGLVIDVDGGGDPLATNLAAAPRIARLLRLWQVGGATLIDFRGLATRRARQQVTDAMLAALAASDPRPFDHTAINGFGLMQVVRARARPSVLDRLLGTEVAGPSVETRALRLLADAVRSGGIGARTVVAPAAVIDWLAGWPHLLDQAAARLGAPVRLRASGDSGDGHVHVEHP